MYMPKRLCHSYLLLPLLAFFLFLGCANKVTRGVAATQKQVVFEFSVKGKLALNNPNVTYYIAVYAPSDKKGQDIDASINGPRFNGPALNFGPQVLDGRLPFIGLLPGDQTSLWTDFYYLKGSVDGQGIMGRGKLNAGQKPEIVQANYPFNTLWRVKSPSTFEVQIRLADLTSGIENAPNNLVFQIGTGDNIDEGGQGFVFDYWRNNLPFAIKTTQFNNPIQDRDETAQLALRQIPGKPLPQLPAGVTQNDVDILSYSYRIIQ